MGLGGYGKDGMGGQGKQPSVAVAAFDKKAQVGRINFCAVLLSFPKWRLNTKLYTETWTLVSAMHIPQPRFLNSESAELNGNKSFIVGSSAKIWDLGQSYTG